VLIPNPNGKDISPVLPEKGFYDEASYSLVRVGGFFIWVHIFGNVFPQKHGPKCWVPAVTAEAPMWGLSETIAINANPSLLLSSHMPKKQPKITELPAEVANEEVYARRFHIDPHTAAITIANR